MKKIVREYEFSPEQLDKIDKISRALNLHKTTARILYARGVDTEEKMRDFLSPSTEQFLSPFLMSGMKEAVSLLQTARDEGWRVAVFGDYDADGIGALAIMDRGLRKFGIEPYLYVPERAEGYGMNVEAIDKIFDEFLPDVMITVDCGISNRKEVEYIKEQGAYVIVTDHHELPEEIPNCICINPKFQDDYPYDNLCGAGVAFKLVQALVGENAYSLLDFAALSTVADSVPLLGENRAIVSEGLRRVATSPRPAFSALIGKQSGDITAQTLAFTVAPRINAAGRMGDAASALRLFTTDDEGEIFDLAAKLNAYNMERQKCCDELYAQAIAQIKQKGAFGHLIMLYGESWSAGFVGIVAARIAEEFGRPTILFVKNGDMLKGSARSIESVNIFDALRACSHLIEEFGGHAQAAGINVRLDRFDELESALDEYIGKTYTQEDFIPKIYVAEEMKGAFPVKLARELASLEPFGMGHRKPLFCTSAEKMTVSPVKPASPHLSLSADGLDFMYFGGAKHQRLLRSDLKKTLVFECNLSRFRGKEYLKGFIRNVLYDGLTGTEIETDCFERSLDCSVPVGAISLSTQETEELIRAKRKECPYGLCILASNRSVLKRYACLDGLDVNVFTPASSDLQNGIVISPDEEYDFSGYRDVVCLDSHVGRSYSTGKATVYVNQTVDGGTYDGIQTERETLLQIFTAIRNRTADITGETYAEAARSCDGLGYPHKQFIFALSVFEELGILSLKEGRIHLVRGKKTELTYSKRYLAAIGNQEEV